MKRHPVNVGDVIMVTQKITGAKSLYTVKNMFEDHMIVSNLKSKEIYKWLYCNCFNNSAITYQDKKIEHELAKIYYGDIWDSLT